MSDDLAALEAAIRHYEVDPYNFNWQHIQNLIKAASNWLAHERARENVLTEEQCSMENAEAMRQQLEQPAAAPDVDEIVKRLDERVKSSHPYCHLKEEEWHVLRGELAAAKEKNQVLADKLKEWRFSNALECIEYWMAKADQLERERDDLKEDIKWRKYSYEDHQRWIQRLIDDGMIPPCEKHEQPCYLSYTIEVEKALRYAAGLRQQLAARDADFNKLKELAEEVHSWHSDPDSADYQDCDKNKCQWCELVHEITRPKGNADAADSA